MSCLQFLWADSDRLLTYHLCSSITPLKANFMHYDGLVGQEIKM